MEWHDTFHVLGVLPDFEGGCVIVVLLYCAQNPSVLAGICRVNVKRPSECPAFGDRFDQRKAAENVLSIRQAVE